MLIRGWKNTFVLYHIFGCRLMKRKFKQWQSTIPPISTKWTTTSHFKQYNDIWS